jgi:hypothetical protein
VSRNLDTARLIFDTPGLAVCDSSRSDRRTSVRSAESVKALADQPAPGRVMDHIAEVARPAYEKSRQEALLEVQ